MYGGNKLDGNFTPAVWPVVTSVWNRPNGCAVAGTRVGFLRILHFPKANLNSTKCHVSLNNHSLFWVPIFLGGGGRATMSIFAGKRTMKGKL
jgi:hypothetical protein